MKKVVKYPCRNCLYFDACGDNQRTEFCGGRYLKSQKKAAEKHRKEMEKREV